jgi:hypothetical protein
MMIEFAKKIDIFFSFLYICKKNITDCFFSIQMNEFPSIVYTDIGNIKFQLIK